MLKGVINTDQHHISSTAKVSGLMLLLLSSAAFPVSAYSQTPQQEGEATVETTLQGEGASTEAPTSTEAESQGEIVVTATRTSTTLSKVPASIAALGTEQLDDRGIKNVEDLVLTVPGVSATRIAGTGTSIAIRGVASLSGASTTGVYVNDTPIQSRAIGQSFSFATTYPLIFDLERVEVLRGPQGTLFGAGSQGGTIRFITPQPSLDFYDIYGRAELGITEGGAASYEAGLAVGGPIVADKLGFRVSGYYQRDGGFIDLIDGTNGELLEKNFDDINSVAIRGALTFAPVDSVRITPAVLYQRIHVSNDRIYEPLYSDVGRNRFVSTARLPSPTKDRFVLPSLDISIDAGAFTIYSNSSYLDRRTDLKNDLGRFVISLFGTVTPELIEGPLKQYSNLEIDLNTQRSFSQEIRVQSGGPGDRLRWVLGAFYQHSKQRAVQLLPDTEANMNLLMQTFFGMDAIDVLGTPIVEANYNLTDQTRFSYINDVRTVDQQLAAFFDLTYELVDGLSVNVGARIAKTKLSFTSYGDGPYNSGLAQSEGSIKDTPITPKLNISYQADPDNLFYATASKGFRVGGVNASLPSYCLSELEPLGYSDGFPNSYDSDSVWSYEVGSKNALFNRKLRLATSAYVIKWKGIQQTVNISCGGFVDNLGKATSKGFDLAIDFSPVDDLTLSIAAGYTDAKFTETILGENGPPLINAGDYIAISPWVVSTSVTKNFQIAERDVELRVDYQYKSAVRPGPELNPETSQFDPRAVRISDAHMVNARIGAQIGPVDVALFVRNLLNSHHTANVSTPTRRRNFLDEYQTVRPRTFGLQVTYRH